MAVILVSLTLTILSSRKLIIDKIRKETLNSIYNKPDLSYREVLNILKEEAIAYATDNNVTKESIKIDDFNTSISKEIINAYKLKNNYLTVALNNSNYDIYLGKKETIIGNNKEVKDLIDIIDYKIEGNSVQDLSSGVPSPTSPKEVVSVGDKITDNTDSNYGKYNIPITISGKNIFNFDKMKGQVTSTVNYDDKTLFLSSSNGLYIIGQSFTGTSIAFEKFNEVFNIMEPDYYCLKVKVTSDIEDIQPKASWKINVVGDGSSAPVFISQTYKNGYVFVKYQITEEILDSIKNYANTVRLYIYGFIANETKEYVDVTISDIIFAKGNYTFDTMPNYEPYVEPQTTNIYLDNPLRKVGDKTDYISFSENNIKRKVGVYTFNSGIGVNYMKAGSGINNFYNNFISFKSANDKMLSGTNIAGYSNVLPSNKQTWGKWTEEQVQFGQNNSSIYFVLNEKKETIDDVYNYLSNNGTVEPYFIYQLNTEQTQPISLSKFTFQVGSEYISVDTDIEPSNVEFTVIKKIKQL